MDKLIKTCIWWIKTLYKKLFVILYKTILIYLCIIFIWKNWCQIMFFDTITYNVRSWFMFLSYKFQCLVHFILDNSIIIWLSVFIFVEKDEIFLKIALPLFSCGDMEIIWNIEEFCLCIWNIRKSIWRIQTCERAPLWCTLLVHICINAQCFVLQWWCTRACIPLQHTLWICSTQLTISIYGLQWVA